MELRSLMAERMLEKAYSNKRHMMAARGDSMPRNSQGCEPPSKFFKKKPIQKLMMFAADARTTDHRNSMGCGRDLAMMEMWCRRQSRSSEQHGLIGIKARKKFDGVLCSVYYMIVFTLVSTDGLIDESLKDFTLPRRLLTFTERQDRDDSVVKDYHVTVTKGSVETETLASLNVTVSRAHDVIGRGLGTVDKV
ncbi:hypothetical protein CHS0354_042730 [Potamilus streckersoni]|uniref:Uncharacterized protein n=1 Tax=Potamilus streckersoni TaxID=2493646 RepID=A0AAE0SAE6_9BIVA|nr:hypothetical protein CHS0354_042730 [Potamilus streckersoni]